LGLTVGTGLKSALNYSVFAASARAFALATADWYRWSLDTLLTSRAQRALHHPSESAAAESVGQATRDSVRTNVRRPGTEED
jgi:hypothetical protein